MSCSFFSFSCQCCARSCLWPFLQGIYSVECQWPCVPLKLNRLRTFRQDKLKLSMLSLLTFFSLLSSEIHFFPLGLFWSRLAHPISYSILLFHHQLKKKKRCSRLHLCFEFIFFFCGNMTPNSYTCHCKIFNRVSVSKTLRCKQKGDAVWESCQAWTSYEEVLLG